jgi:hypothetical protein
VRLGGATLCEKKRQNEKGKKEREIEIESEKREGDTGKREKELKDSREIK